MLDLIFLIAAAIGGTIMVCQFILTVMGIGDDGDLSGDASFDHADIPDVDVPDGDLAHQSTLSSAADAEYQHPDSSWLFGVLSFRAIVAGAAFFGLAGRAASSAGWRTGPSLLIAIAVGLGAMYAMYWLMQLISKTTSSGNERIVNSLGRPATVYVAIPAEHQGTGKVQLTMQNRIVEFQAITPEAEPLKSGEKVEVIRVVNSDTVEVCRERNTVEATS